VGVDSGAWVAVPIPDPAEVGPGINKLYRKPLFT
jgi:hypothetical protein